MSDHPPPVPPPPLEAGAPAPDFGAAGFQSLQYTPPLAGRRPGILTAVGIISICVASVSGLVGFMTVVYGVGIYSMSMALSRLPAGGAAGMGGAGGAAAATPAAPQGMTPAEREAAVRTLTQAQRLDSRRLAQLEAILTASGKSLGTDLLVDNGTMPDSRTGEAGPEYYVTRRGRLEVFNDRAIFFPNDGSPTIRTSAPQPSSTMGVEVPEVHVHDAVAAPATAAATAPATSPAAGLSALTPAEVQAVIQQAQAQAKAAGTAALNPQQVAALDGLLSAPVQQFVLPATVAAPPGTQPAVAGAGAGVAPPPGAVMGCSVDAAGNASVVFNTGSSVVLGPQGEVLSQFNPKTFMAGYSFNPWAIALFIAMSVLAFALAVLLLVAGILVLTQSPRGRRLHLIYAGLKIPVALVGGFSIGFLMYEMVTGFSSAGVLPNQGSDVGVAVVWAVIPAVLGCLYPVALLIAMNVRSVREYYHSVVAGA